MKLKLLLLTIFLTANLQAQNNVLRYLQNAQPDAKQSVLVFYRQDCPYCLKMDQAISKDQPFQESLKNNFNVVLVDIKTVEGKNLAAQYSVKGVPAIIKLDNETNQFTMLKGFNSTTKLAGFLGMTTAPTTANAERNALGTIPVCGNGLTEFGEQCDDANTVNGDGCSATCQIENPVCGDGIIETGETCDDSNTTNGDGCSATCQLEPAVCGDGIIQAGEQCDDSNITNGDGCSATCQTEVMQVCGDGIIQAGEQCDDGNIANGDGCSATCQAEGFTVNDDCAGAIALTIGAAFEDNPVTGTSIGATTSATLPSCQTTAFFDTWYKVTVPASGSVTVETQETTDTEYVGDTVLTIYSGTCGGTLTELACSDDANGLMSLVNVSEQTPGTTLYIAVWTYGDDADNQGTFQVSAYDIPAPANDTCANAAALTVGGTFESNTVNGLTTGANTTLSTEPSCQGNSSADTWYQIVVPASGSVTVETQITDPAELYDSVLTVYSGTCGSLTEIGCNDDGGLDDNALMSKVELTGQTAGATLYVAVWKYGGDVDNAGAFKVAAYDASLSTPSFDAASLSMYPNPVKDVLNITYLGIISKVQVYSILGQEVTTKLANQNQIDMSPLASGTYFVKVTSEGMVKTLKVIKE
jgi:cysteine-rich repeat protein